MANRVMQQKRLKIVRMRRAWAKPLSRKAGTNPNRIVINEYKERALGLSVDEDVADKIAAELIMREDMKFGALTAKRLAEAGVRPRDFKADKPTQKLSLPDRIEALRRQGELEATLPDGCDLRITGPGPCTPYQECFTYFNAKKTVWLVIHRDLHRRIERRSVTYPSHELLLMYWGMDKTTWIERHPIEVPPSG